MRGLFLLANLIRQVDRTNRTQKSSRPVAVALPFLSSTVGSPLRHSRPFDSIQKDHNHFSGFWGVRPCRSSRKQGRETIVNLCPSIDPSLAPIHLPKLCHTHNQSRHVYSGSSRRRRRRGERTSSSLCYQHRRHLVVPDHSIDWPPSRQAKRPRCA